MKEHFNSKYFRWGLTAFCVIAASMVFYTLLFHGANIMSGIGKLADIMMPVVIGLVLAYVLTPLMNQIEYRAVKPLVSKLPLKTERKKNSAARGISIFITVILFLAVIYALISIFISQIVPSVMNLVSNFDTYVANVTNMLNKLLEDNPDVGNYVIKMINQYSVDVENWLNETVDIVTTGSQVIKAVSLSVISMLGVLLDWIIGFIISIYVLASKEKFAGQAKKVIYAIFEKERANQIISTFRFTHKTFIGFFSGKVLDSIIIGLLCFMGTTILRTPYPALVSVIIGITNIIPFFGPALGAVPSTILIFLVDPMHPLNAVYFVIFILVLQQFDGNILGPKILGESTGLSSFWVIFAITLFGGAFGVVGMIVGVPVFAVIYAGLKALVKSTLAKKRLPQGTVPYMNVESIDDAGIFHTFVPDYQKKIDAQREARTQKVKTKNDHSKN